MVMVLYMVILRFIILKNYGNITVVLGIEPRLQAVQHGSEISISTHADQSQYSTRDNPNTQDATTQPAATHTATAKRH